MRFVTLMIRCSEIFSWIKTDTGDRRLADCPEFINRKDIKTPDYFASHAWKGTFKQLERSISNFLRNASEHTSVWIDFIAVNQHSKTCPLINKADVASFESTVKICRGTIVIVDMAHCNPASRGWCLFEWDKALKHHGFDGLSFGGMSLEDRMKVIAGIDVDNAECFSPADLEMILGNIRHNYGTTAAFNTYLKLQLLLCPLSYKTDLAQLAKRSEGTKWDFGRVREWLENDTRCLCFEAGAGTGKSTVSAALISELFPLITSPTEVHLQPLPMSSPYLNVRLHASPHSNPNLTSNVTASNLIGTYTGHTGRPEQ